MQTCDRLGDKRDTRLCLTLADVERSDPIAELEAERVETRSSKREFQQRGRAKSDGRGCANRSEGPDLLGVVAHRIRELGALGRELAEDGWPDENWEKPRVSSARARRGGGDGGCRTRLRKKE